MTSTDRLAGALWEADRHAAALADALADWQSAQVPDTATLEADKALVRLVDQLLFRFMKLQDAIGERLVAATLAALAEPFESWPMRDRLDRLEKLSFLEVDSWLRWRAVCSRLAHEYPDRADHRFTVLTSAIDAARELLVAFAAWRAKLIAAGSATP